VGFGSEACDVDKVTPTGVGGASLDGCDDLFGKDEFDAIAEKQNGIATEKSRHRHPLGCWKEWVTDVDIDMEPNASGSKPSFDLGARARVHIVFSDCLDCCRREIEGEAVVPSGREDVIDDFVKVLGILFQFDGCEVNVSGWTTSVKQGEQGAALEYKVLIVG